MIVGGTPVATLSGALTLIDGVSHTSISVVVTDGDLTPSGVAEGFSSLAGLQLIQAPEPALMAMLASGATMLALVPGRKSLGTSLRAVEMFT